MNYRLVAFLRKNPDSDNKQQINKTMNENKETEKVASIKSEARITQEDIINKIAEETNISEKDVREVLDAIANVVDKL